MSDIKNFLPKKDTRFHQGVLSPLIFHKVFPSQKNKPIIYRSSWERKFIGWAEHNKGVKYWGSECGGIKYRSSVDNNIHTYYPDFFLEMEDGRKIVVEIKPKNQVKKPEGNNPWMVKTWMKNMSKWKTLKEICDQKNWSFWIITEDTVNRL